MVITKEETFGPVYSGGGSLGPLVQPLLQGNGVVASFVAGGEKQGDGLPAQAIEQVSDRRLLQRLFEFGIIGGLEFIPSRRIAVEAAAQGIARGDFLQPKVDLRPLAQQPPRPQAINQNADPVFVARRLINTFDA